MTHLLSIVSVADERAFARAVSTVAKKARVELSIFACMLLIVLTVTGFNLGRYYGAAAAIYSGLFLAIISTMWANGKEIRQRIVALLGIFIGIMLVFGGVHYALFLHQPTMYAFSSSIEEGKTLEVFKRDFEHVLDLSAGLYVLGVADAQIEKVFEASKNPTEFVNPTRAQVEPEEGFVQLSNDSRLRFRHDALYGGRMIAHIYLIEVRWKERAITFGSDLPIEPQARQVFHLFGASSENEFRVAFDGLIEVVKVERDEALRSVEAQISLRPEWELVDFVYFSTITLTTVGYGDIVPNSTEARVVVLLNSITGVFFIAFALIFLWPNREVRKINP